MIPLVKKAFCLSILLFALLVNWHGKNIPPRVIMLQGNTMGTTYHIAYFDSRNRNFQNPVDSLLVLINKSINTYDTSSEISIFNKTKRSFVFKLPYFLPPLKKSQEVAKASGGAYDPTVMPLVNAWGFGPRKIERPDTNEIMALRKFIGFNKIQFNNDSIWKSDPHVQIDFSAIGQGYGADVIAEFLNEKSIENYFIELGGEGVARGKNLIENRYWQVGILEPNREYLENKLISQAILKNKGFTTSGNYYNYREVNGKRYSHTIDPSSGFPVQHELLSATVFAADCATADAWATAFMSMGLVKALEILKDHPELDVFFVYAGGKGNKTFVSKGLNKILKSTNGRPNSEKMY